MTSLAFTSHLMCLLLWGIVWATDVKGSSLYVYQKRDYISADAGGNVTLPCFYNHTIATLFSWYKQALGGKLRLVAKFYKYSGKGEFSDEFKNNQKYWLQTKDGQFNLTISDLDISDTATYFCTGSSTQVFDFGEGATVVVKGSGLDMKVLVRRSTSETFLPEDDVTLGCTVHRSHGTQSVYSYESSEEPSLGFFYVEESENDRLEVTPNTQTCMYLLPHESRRRSHSGSNVCAVASCGRVLLGNGSQIKDRSPPFILVSILSGALAFTIALSLSLGFIMFKLKKRDHGQYTDSPTTVEPAMTNLEGCEDVDGLHYAALRKQTLNRPRRQKDNTQTECVYSSVLH